MTARRTSNDSALSADMLSTLLHASPLHVLLADARGKILWINHLPEGFSMESTLGANLADIVPPGYDTVAMDSLKKAIEQNLSSLFVTQGNSLTDEEVWYEVALAPIAGADGEEPLAAVYARQINTEIRTMHQLNASEAFNRALIAESPIGVSIRSPQGKLLSYNKAWQKIWNIPDKDIQKDLGKERVELSLDNRDGYLGEWAPLVKNIYTEGGHLHIPEMQTTGRRPGSARWVSQHFYSIKDSSGAVERVVILTVDISPAKEAEETRLNLEARLKEAQKAESLAVMAGGIAHDFNNLLMAVLGNAELAMASIPTGSPARQCITEVIAGARRAAELSQQMLTYSGKSVFGLTSVSLNEVIESIRVDFESDCARRGIDIGFNLEPCVPDIKGDIKSLRTILTNLVVNSIESIEHDNGQITVSTFTGSFKPVDPGLDCRGTDGECRYVVMEVSDNGCGMDRNTRARVFDPFFSTKFPGRGLGLSTVYGLVKAHYGDIRLQSGVKGGTGIQVRFPLQTEGPVSYPCKGRNVLLAVGSDEIRESASQLLESLGLIVTEAADGASALKALKACPGHFNLTLCEASLPSNGALAVIREMKKLRPDLPAILVGDRTGDEDDIPPDAPVECRISYPFSTSEVKQALQKIFNHNGRH